MSQGFKLIFQGFSLIFQGLYLILKELYKIFKGFSKRGKIICLAVIVGIIITIVIVNYNKPLTYQDKIDQNLEEIKTWTEEKKLSQN